MTHGERHLSKVLDPPPHQIHLARPPELLDLMEHAVMVMSAGVVCAEGLVTLLGVDVSEHLMALVGLPMPSRLSSNRFPIVYSGLP
jgi:hypothetical protein